MSGLVTAGGDCRASAPLAKSNEDQPKRLPYDFARDDVGRSFRCPHPENDEMNALGTAHSTAAASRCGVN